MGRFIRYTATAVALGAASAAGSYYYAKNYIYVGTYYEKPPFDPSKLSTWERFKHKFIGTTDDVSQTLSYKLVNPNNNVPAYDYYEKTIDADTTAKILKKYKTNDEILTQLQKGVFLGPTLWFHRFVIGPYFQRQGDFNRIAGSTYFEPELKRLDLSKLPRVKKLDFYLLPKSDKIEYVWSYQDVSDRDKPFRPYTAIYGLFDFTEYGKRTNGGYFQFLFGSDLLENSAIHRFEYFTEKNVDGRDEIIVRFTNVTTFIPKNSPPFVDDTNGLHELMTRTMVNEAIRGLTKDLD